MDYEALLRAIQQLRQLAEEQSIRSGSIPHVLAAFQSVVEARMQGQEARLEQQFHLTITESRGQIIGYIEESTRRLQRDVDVAINSAATNLEHKTTESVQRLFNEMQIYRDVIINAVAGRISTLQAHGVELSPENVARLESELTQLFRRMIQERFSPMLLTEGFERLRFVDAAGRAFEPAIRELFGPDGPITIVSLQAVQHSPNFRPAMEVLFGSSGKLADAAHAAAQGVNLEPALENFEQELEEGVTEALDEAGDAAQAHGAAELGARVGEGARALGSILTSVPQMYESVTALGEAWDRPLESTQDYMNLFSALGNTINQGVETFEALAGVTRIASAAQAIFNAVMAMNPIVLIVIAVIALIAAIALLIIYWDEVKAAVRDNPWLPAILILFGPFGILIGLIILIAAYWDEVKLAVLKAANFISIQAQRIGQFFVGLGTLISQVWDWIVAGLYNLGVGFVNIFIDIGASIMNFFVDLVNFFIDTYNDIAAYIPGLDEIDRLERVNAEAARIAERPMPEISVERAFAGAGPITGGLEGQIAAQEAAIASAQEEAERTRRETEAPAAPPTALPAPGAGPLPIRPALPEGIAPAAAGGPVDQSVHVEGGITINIDAERLEADSAQLLSDEIIRRIQERLSALRAEQEFRTGTRVPAAA